MADQSPFASILFSGPPGTGLGDALRLIATQRYAHTRVVSRTTLIEHYRALPDHAFHRLFAGFIESKQRIPDTLFGRATQAYINAQRAEGNLAVDQHVLLLHNLPASVQETSAIMHVVQVPLVLEFPMRRSRAVADQRGVNALIGYARRREWHQRYFQSRGSSFVTLDTSRGHRSIGLEALAAADAIIAQLPGYEKKEERKD